MVQLLGKEAGTTGFGLMGFTWRAKPCSQEQAFEAMREAIQQGKIFWNAGEFYGTPEYNSLVLLERYFERYPEDADKIILSVKGGISLTDHRPDQSPEGIRRSLDNSIGQLKGRKKLDIFEFARRDQNADMAKAFNIVQKEYIETGKIGGIALSEVRAETIHEAVKHLTAAKIVAVEVELSLFATDILHNGVARACAQYNIPLVAYSPMGRGFLTGQIKTYDDVPHELKNSPRFQPGGNFENNIRLVHQVEELAKHKSCTPAQLALSWVRALNGRPEMPAIIPIPGATTVERVRENAKVVELTDNDMASIDKILSEFKPVGRRYPDFVPIET
ncbi:aldo/keto reductase [Astrocystis sublimbata]|nr:aldo/keto reductase [Astrocystis sublimbata]